MLCDLVFLVFSHSQERTSKHCGRIYGFLCRNISSSVVAFLQCEAPKIAFSWFITPITMVYGTQITIVTGANLNQLITGGHHPVVIVAFLRIYKNIDNIETLGKPQININKWGSYGFLSEKWWIYIKPLRFRASCLHQTEVEHRQVANFIGQIWTSLGGSSHES